MKNYKQNKVLVFLLITISCLLVMNLEGCSKSSVLSGGLKDGKYSVNVKLEGGTGKTGILSPAEAVCEKGSLVLKITFNSKNYDYVSVNGKKYFNQTPGEFSTFSFPVKNLQQPIVLFGNTTAMSVPHEIKYVLKFTDFEESANLKKSTDTKSTFKDLKKESNRNSEISNSSEKKTNLKFKDIDFSKEIPLFYAKEFSVFKSDSEEYTLIKLVRGKDFLVVKENSALPEEIPENVVVLKQPLENVYLVSTSVMDLICRIGALDKIKYSGTREKDWFVEEAAAAMKEKQILYAGKYSAPDFELLYSGNCSLAIQNNMIYHKPEIKEKLEELGIPVFVETSTYESHPLGRLEWIKIYGILFGKEKEAEDYFNSQLESFNRISQNILAPEKQTVAFFYVTSNGSVNVRKPNDYIAKMISLAGGNYVFQNLKFEEENSLSTLNMQMEDFYVSAVNADIIIYNSTIDGEIYSVKDLLRKEPLFADFKAVKNNQVYCTDKKFFQKSSGVVDFMSDVNGILNGEDGSLTYIKKLK